MHPPLDISTRPGLPVVTTAAKPPSTPPDIFKRTLRWVDIALIFGIFVLIEMLVAPAFARALYNDAHQLGLPMDRFPIPIIAQITAQEVLILLVVGLLAAWRGLRFADFGFRGTKFTWYLIGVGLAVVALPLRVLVGLAAQMLFGGGLENLMPVDDGWAFPLVGHPAIAGLPIVLLAGVLGPLTEEVIFRGAFYAWLRKRAGVTLAVLVSSAVFGVIHTGIGTGVAAFLMGILLALAYEHSKSLWVPIVMHALNNGLVLGLVFFALGIQEIFGLGQF